MVSATWSASLLTQEGNSEVESGNRFSARPDTICLQVMHGVAFHNVNGSSSSAASTDTLRAPGPPRRQGLERLFGRCKIGLVGLTSSAMACNCCARRPAEGGHPTCPMCRRPTCPECSYSAGGGEWCCIDCWMDSSAAPPQIELLRSDMATVNLTFTGPACWELQEYIRSQYRVLGTLMGTVTNAAVAFQAASAAVGEEYGTGPAVGPPSTAASTHAPSARPEALLLGRRAATPGHQCSPDRAPFACAESPDQGTGERSGQVCDPPGPDPQPGPGSA